MPETPPLWASPPPVLDVAGLSIALLPGSDRPFAVSHLSFTAARGETLCVVGESGSGKSLTALAIMGLLPRSVGSASGRIRVGGQDLLGMSERAMRERRGSLLGNDFSGAHELPESRNADHGP